MSDTTPTGQRQGTGRTPTVTVSEAAAVLGISPDAVRGRLQRGTLVGQKIAGTWHVHLSTDGSSTGDQRVMDGPATGHRQDALVAHLEGEVAYLRERLEEADRQQAQMLGQLAEERQRADVLQLRAIGTGETSPNTPSEAPGSSESDDQPLQGVRAWWKRWWSS